MIGLESRTRRIQWGKNKMPETSIVFNREDEELLVSAMLRAGARFVAMRQTVPEYDEISDLKSFKAKRASEGFFCALHDSYFQEPLSLWRVDAGYHEGTYTVEQRVGGPAIDVLCCVEYSEDNTEWISGGSIGYYKTYKSLISGEYEPTPKSLITFYKKIIKEIKVDGKVIQGSFGRKWLVGPSALARLKNGDIKLNIDVHIDWNAV